MESSGPSSIHGAMSALGCSIGGGRFDVDGIGPLAPSDLCLFCPGSKRGSFIASTGVTSSGESEKKVPLPAWIAKLCAALRDTQALSAIAFSYRSVARLQGDMSPATLLLAPVRARHDGKHHIDPDGDLKMILQVFLAGAKLGVLSR